MICRHCGGPPPSSSSYDKEEDAFSVLSQVILEQKAKTRENEGMAKDTRRGIKSSTFSVEENKEECGRYSQNDFDEKAIDGMGRRHIFWKKAHYIF